MCKSIVLALFLPALFVLGTVGCSSQSEEASRSKAKGPPLEFIKKKREAKEKGDPSSVPEVDFEDVKEGVGPAITEGNSVTVDYTGWLADGTKFDSTLDKKKPYTFRMSSRYIIKGWKEGLVGMKTGGTRLLWVPSDLAYGKAGHEPEIPPNADLVFEIHVLKLE
jgi:peptidylprolyl isomerase